MYANKSHCMYRIVRQITNFSNQIMKMVSPTSSHQNHLFEIGIYAETESQKGLHNTLFG